MAEAATQRAKDVETPGDSDAGFAFAVQSYHMQLHFKIAEYSGCAALTELLDKNHLLVLNWIFDLVVPQISRPARLHRDLLDAVTGGSVDAAEAAMREHVRMGLDDTIQAVARLNSGFDDRWRIRDPGEKSNPKPGEMEIKPPTLQIPQTSRQ